MFLVSVLIYGDYFGFNKMLEKIQTFFPGKNALSCIIQSTKIQKIKIYCLFDTRKEFLKYLILIKIVVQRKNFYSPQVQLHNYVDIWIKVMCQLLLDELIQFSQIVSVLLALYIWKNTFRVWAKKIFYQTKHQKNKRC